MKRKIVGIFVCILLVTIPVITLSVSADPEPELKVGVFGGSLLTGLRQVGGVIFNNGDDVAYDIHYTFAITGGLDDSINIVIPGQKEELESNEAIVQLTNRAYGFGSVKITLTATSSNAGEATETIKGFQMGPYTISKSYVLAWY